MTAATTYQYELRDAFDDVNLEDWNQVAQSDRNPFVESGFVRAVERTLTDPGKFWYAVFYDDNKRPVACACFSLFDVDGTLLAPHSVQSFARTMRKVFSRFMKFRMLLCGLPPSVSGNNIAATVDVDWDRLSATLAEICETLAKQEKALLISMKEFSPRLTEKLSSLTSLGYHRGDSIRTYILNEPCGSFDEYYQSRSKRTRANMRKYFKQVEDAGITWEWRAGKDDVAELYSQDVHQLYDAVFEKAEVKFEYIPADFFRELARQCPENSRFTLFRQNDKIVGYCVGIVGSETYHLIYCGFDYELNNQTSLYFNILYRGVEDAYQQDRREIHIGAAADEFKRRMGCDSEVLSVFVKGVGIIAGTIFRWVAPLMFPKLSEPADEPPQDI